MWPSGQSRSTTERLVEQPPGSAPPKVIRSFSRGIDAFSTSVDDTGPSTVALYTRVNCRTSATDVYKVTVP